MLPLQRGRGIITSCDADTLCPQPQWQLLKRFHINHVASATRSLICLVTLTFDLWPWNWCALPVGATFHQFWCLWDFSFSTYGPTPVKRTTWYRDIDLWPFYLEPGARYCPWSGQPFCQFWCSFFWNFSFSTYGPTTVRRTTWPCDLDL